MTFSKRVFDILLALGLLIVLSPVIGLVAGLILVKDGRPVFYRSERMKTVMDGFTLWKFRTMHGVPRDRGVSGGHKSKRITPTGAFLRRVRLDELPQLWNILAGDMSFVGPRPPLRRYTDRFPELYRQVLKNRPGVTGLATLHLHGFEARVLGHCKNSAETDRTYVRRCVPRKARLDILYGKNQSICVDIALIWQTMLCVFLR